MRRHGAAPGVEPYSGSAEAVAPTAPALASTPMAKLHDESRPRPSPWRHHRRQADSESPPAPPDPDGGDGEDADAIIPHSMIRAEPVPAESLLKRVYAASRIARYRRISRRRLTGRHEDVSV